MPDLGFKIEGAEVAKFSATPQIVFKLRVTNADPAETIHSVALRCQIQIEVTRRRYTRGRPARSCAICLASPTAGARLCATCCGLMST